MDKTAAFDPAFCVGFLLIDDFALMSYAAAIEPLRAANLLARRTIYDIRHISAMAAQGDGTDDAVAVSSSGAVVSADVWIGEHLDFDLLFVVAGGDPSAFHEPRLFQWLRHLARRGVHLGGISGGPVILAKAGVMANRRMTVHWEHRAALGEIAPSLMIERTLYVIDRDRITCAGGIAPLDMMHALITEHHGGDFARKVSDWFMHTQIRPSGGAQRASLTERYGITCQQVLIAIEAMQNHIADPLGLVHLARMSGVSPRQLNRLFHDKLSRSTMAFYRDLRLEKACNLLQHTPLSITEIALATGFAGSAHFSQAFRRKFGDTPSSMRRPAATLNAGSFC